MVAALEHGDLNGMFVHMEKSPNATRGLEFEKDRDKRSNQMPAMAINLLVRLHCE